MKVKKEVRGVLEELSEFSFEHSEWAVLVEGKRDVEVLRFFGVKNVIQMKGMNYHSLAESICKKFNGVVILTDLDKKGEEISKKLGKIFKNYGLKTNLYFRNRLKEVGVFVLRTY